MKNIVEYYINYNKNLCSPLQEEQLQSSPSINPSDLNPLITYLALNNYLSEFETELEKRRAMLNLLLIDPIPKEDSTNLVDSGTVFKIMREGKLERDQLTELFNSLQRRKADKSELFSKKYSDLTGVPKKLSNFENDLNLISQTYLLELLLNYKSEIQEYIQHNQGEIDPQQVSEVVTQLVIEKLSRLAQVAFSGDYDDLTSKPDIPTKVSDLENDSLYVTSSEVSSEVSSAVNTAVSNLVNGAPEALDTLKEIADKLSDNDDAVAGLINQITEETSRAKSAENTLSTDLNNEISRAKAAEKANSDNIDALNTALNDEISRAQRVEANKANISDLDEKANDSELAAVAKSGDYKDLKNVPVIEANPGNREYIDLGLPSGTLWATMNVGANSETDNGLYFQWGDTQGYTASEVGSGSGLKAFTWADYKFNPSGDGKTFTKYNGTDGKTVLDLEDDAVAANWGGDWHMPTEAQFQELLNTEYCTNAWTSINGVNGRLFTSVTNGNTLFIPAAGRANNSSVNFVDSGNVYSSSLVIVSVKNGDFLYFNSKSNFIFMSSSPRCVGCSVRGVLDTTPINKLHKVAESGDYNDLENIPTNISHFNNDAEYVTESELAPVAKSGSYTDLENKPDYLGYTDTAIANLINSAPTTLDTLKEIADKLGENDSALSTIMNTLATKANKSDVQDNEQVISTALNNLNNRIIELDTDKVDNSDLATVATTGSYTDLSDIPTIPAAQILSDWNLTDTSSKDYIKNKPTNVSLFTNDANYVTKEELDNTEEVVAAALNDLNTNKADKTEVFPVKATYEEMVEMRNLEKFIPGQYYQITDYVTTSMAVNTQSMKHQFDILVRADSNNTLNEQAWAIRHEGDTYFKDARLEAWELKYQLDNVWWSQRVGTLIEDKNDGYTALSIGTVDINNETYILWDASEFEDDYDFTQMVSLTKNVGAEMLQYDPETGEIVVDDGYTTTIAEILGNYSEPGKGTITWMKDEHGNECPYDFKNVQFKRYMATDSMSGRSGLNNKYMVADPHYLPYGLSVEDTENFIWAYTFSSDNTRGEQIDYSLTTEHQVYNNVFRPYNDGLPMLPNNVMFGENNYGNSFGANCYKNSWSSLNLNNSWGSGCSYNSWGNYCQNNSWGNNCCSNSWGNNCYSNSWGNNCYSNSLGNNCNQNSWGNNCYSNSCGNGCSYNSWGNYCRNNSWGNNVTQSTLFNDVQYTQITTSNVKNVQVLNGVKGTSSNKLTLNFEANKTYTQVATMTSKGELKIYVPGDNYLIWSGTQAQYDLIQSPDPNTIYIITAASS